MHLIRLVAAFVTSSSFPMTTNPSTNGVVPRPMTTSTLSSHTTTTSSTAATDSSAGNNNNNNNNNNMEWIAQRLQCLADTHNFTVLDDDDGSDEGQNQNSSNNSKKKKRSRNRNKLQPRHVVEFPSNSLFDQFARAVCQAVVIPRKEVFEAWAMALYVHYHFISPNDGECRPHRRRRRVNRIADLACSHGLLSWALLLLSHHNERDHECHRCRPTDTDDSDDTASLLSVVCIDINMPKSSEIVRRVMLERWPDLEKYWDYVEGPVEAFVPDPSTLLVGIHACGLLSDKIITLAINNGGGNSSPLALVPCCHSKKCMTPDQKHALLVRQEEKGDTVASSLSLSCNYTLADLIDQNRIERLQSAGFHVTEALIPKVFTPKNRILLAIPPPSPPPSTNGDSSGSSTITITTTTTTNTVDTAIITAAFNINKLSVTTKGQPSWGMPKLSIPVADNSELRAIIRKISGRDAANQRILDNKPPPPSLCMSLFLPDDNINLTAQQLQEGLVEQVLIDAEEQHGHEIKCEAVCDEPMLHPVAKRYARTFRIHYHNCTKSQAKQYHNAFREVVPEVFTGAVVRYSKPR